MTMQRLRSILLPFGVLCGFGILIFATVSPIYWALAQEPAVETQSAQETKTMIRTEDEWREMLSAEAYHVLREKGTERPYTNKYDNHFQPGSYACAACGQVLFDSQAKFNSGCGWPAFYAAKAGDRVRLTPDNSFGMRRTEVTCTRCGSHLGHVFDDAPQTPSGQRFCINSVSLKFIPAGELSKDSDTAASNEKTPK